MHAHFAKALGCGVAALVASSALGQSLVAARLPNTVNGQGGSDLIVIDLATGAWDFYLRVPHDVSGSRQLYYLAALPGCKLAASTYRDINSANQSSQYVPIDPFTGASQVLNYGAPVGTLYAEGFEYSPRHNAILLAFSALGNFGTNRLATIDPATGAVLAFTGTLSGVNDLDYIASNDNEDLFFDLNATTASARVRRLTALMPSPAFASFASPPQTNNFGDATRHPTTNQTLFSYLSDIFELAGNTYVKRATLADGAQIRGLAWANLPPRTVMPDYAGVCPGGTATITAKAVGTGPFTYRWRKNGVEIDAIANPTAVTAMLSLSNADATSIADYDCVIENGCGVHITDAVPFILCTADLNCDGAVDDTDFQDFAFQYNVLDCADPSMPAGCPSDLNSDGIVDDVDFQLFVPAYNRLLCGE
mgnify:CR=1 FL=1